MKKRIVLGEGYLWFEGETGMALCKDCEPGSSTMSLSEAAEKLCNSDIRIRLVAEVLDRRKCGKT